MRVPALVLVTCLAGFEIATATDIPVGPGQSIQSAIDGAAATGDKVLVAPGLYAEAIDFKGKVIQVIGVGGPEVTTIDAVGLGKSVVRVTGTNAFARLEGFTLANGAATKGGGIFVDLALLDVVNCVIRDCSAVDGGGASCNGTLNLSNCTFEHNSATKKGGGVYIGFSAISDAHDCRFIENSAEDGGGMASDSSLQSPVTRCQFLRNVATSRGGGVAHFARVFAIDQCRIEGNQANSGGGLFWRFNSLASPANFCVRSCTIFGNQAIVRGGGIHSDSGSADGGFGVFAEMDVSHTSIVANRAPSHGAIESTKFAGAGKETFVGVNTSVCWQNGPNPIPMISSVHVTRCDIEGGFPGTGNFAADPLFVDISAGDLHLRFGSPCIDTGIAAGCFVASAPATDVEGDPFVGPPDVGSDEFHRHIYVTGEVAPSGDAVLHCIGLPGEPVLMLSSASLATPPLAVPPYGTLLLALPLFPGSPLTLRRIDAEGTLATPFLVPHDAGGSAFAVQCLIGATLSNALQFDT